jgi:hypothetical protein
VSLRAWLARKRRIFEEPDCGHACCTIRSNTYHTHICAPEQCYACREAGLKEQAP